MEERIAAFLPASSPFYIRCRICLCISSSLLAFASAVLKSMVSSKHLGLKYSLSFRSRSHHFGDLISGKTLFERTDDDRNEARHRCLKQQITAMCRRKVQKFSSCSAIRSLFRCHHAFRLQVLPRSWTLPVRSRPSLQSQSESPDRLQSISSPLRSSVSTPSLFMQTVYCQDLFHFQLRRRLY